MHASPSVLQVIEHGYVVPFMLEPTQFRGKNQVSALENVNFVSESIKELASSGCVTEVESTPVVCSPLSVVENSGGKGI